MTAKVATASGDLAASEVHGPVGARSSWAATNLSRQAIDLGAGSSFAISRLSSAYLTAFTIAWWEASTAAGVTIECSSFTRCGAVVSVIQRICHRIYEPEYGPVNEAISEARQRAQLAKYM